MCIPMCVPMWAAPGTTQYRSVNGIQAIGAGLAISDPEWTSEGVAWSADHNFTNLAKKSEGNWTALTFSSILFALLFRQNSTCQRGRESTTSTGELPPVTF